MAMDPFPFSEADWQEVSEACRHIVNASFADDAVLRESQFVELAAVLEELRAIYGEHPVLLETEADFTHDAPRRRFLYESAIRSAEKHGFPTYSIRISLARTLLDYFDDAMKATEELQACKADLNDYCDEFERRSWQNLWDEAGKRNAQTK